MIVVAIAIFILFTHQMHHIDHIVKWVENVLGRLNTLLHLLTKMNLTRKSRSYIFITKLIKYTRENITCIVELQK